MNLKFVICVHGNNYIENSKPEKYYRTKKTS